jgi:hypothetical protein
LLSARTIYAGISLSDSQPHSLAGVRGNSIKLYPKSIPEGKSPASQLEPLNIIHLFLKGEFIGENMGEEKLSTYCISTKY